MKNMFSVSGNICGERIKLARALHKPPLTQNGLAIKINFLGMDNITKTIISRIENNKRHVIDAELKVISQALGVSMEWLVQSENEFQQNI